MVVLLSDINYCIHIYLTVIVLNSTAVDELMFCGQQIISQSGRNSRKSAGKLTVLRCSVISFFGQMCFLSFSDFHQSELVS